MVTLTLEERTAAANAEFKEIGAWLNSERRRIYTELNARLGAARRLENSDDNYCTLYIEAATRCLAVRDKYALPPSAKIKMW